MSNTNTLIKNIPSIVYLCGDVVIKHMYHTICLRQKNRYVYQYNTTQYESPAMFGSHPDVIKMMESCKNRLSGLELRHHYMYNKPTIVIKYIPNTCTIYISCIFENLK